MTVRIASDHALDPKMINYLNNHELLERKYEELACALEGKITKLSQRIFLLEKERCLQKRNKERSNLCSQEMEDSLFWPKPTQEEDLTQARIFPHIESPCPTSVMKTQPFELLAEIKKEGKSKLKPVKEADKLSPWELFRSYIESKRGEPLQMQTGYEVEDKLAMVEEALAELAFDDRVKISKTELRHQLKHLEAPSLLESTIAYAFSSEESKRLKILIAIFEEKRDQLKQLLAEEEQQLTVREEKKREEFSVKSTKIDQLWQVAGKSIEGQQDYEKKEETSEEEFEDFVVVSRPSARPSVQSLLKMFEGK